MEIYSRKLEKDSGTRPVVSTQPGMVFVGNIVLGWAVCLAQHSQIPAFVARVAGRRSKDISMIGGGFPTAIPVASLAGG